MSNTIYNSIAGSVTKIANDIGADMPTKTYRYEKDAIADALNAIAVKGISGGAGIFFVTITGTPGEYTADKTLSEIEAAIANGQSIVVHYDNSYYPMTQHQPESVVICQNTSVNTLSKNILTDGFAILPSGVSRINELYQWT